MNDLVLMKMGKKEKIETTPKNIMAKERQSPHAPNIIAIPSGRENDDCLSKGKKNRTGLNCNNNRPIKIVAASTRFTFCGFFFQRSRAGSRLNDSAVRMASTTTRLLPGIKRRAWILSKHQFPIRLRLSSNN